MDNLSLFFHKIIGLFFRRLGVPKTFPSPSSENQYLIVTPNNGIIQSSLLFYLSKKSDFISSEYLNAEKLSSNTRLLENDVLYWTSIEDSTALPHFIKSNLETSVITLQIFRRRGPLRSLPRYSYFHLYMLGFLLTSLLIPASIVVQVGQTLQPRPKLTGPQYQRWLRVQFYKSLKLLRGSPLHALSVQEKIVLGGHEYRQTLTQLSKSHSLSPETIHRKARKEFRHLAANPRYPVMASTAWIARIVLNRLFTEIVTTGLEEYAESAQENPVVLVPMHRSHMDYVLLSLVLYDSRMSPPLVAAGINLNFWPIGWFLRAAGAFFVKRNARQDFVHRLVLSRYISYLVTRGHVQEFFIEGGRSRSGRLMVPKQGLLSMYVSAYEQGLRKDILFVPVSISYENVIETQVYGRENAGESKETKSIFSLLKARRILGQRYGEVSIRFGKALSLASLTEEQSNSQENVARGDYLTPLASRLISDIAAGIDVSLSSLAYTALLEAPHYTLSKEEFVVRVKQLAELSTLLRDNSNLPSKETPSLLSFLEGKHRLLHQLARNGAFDEGIVLGQNVYRIPGKKRFIALFHKNACAHLFAPWALACLADLKYEGIRINEIEPMYPMIAHCYSLPSWNNYKAELESLLNSFFAKGLLRKEGTSYHVVNREQAFFLPTYLLHTIQAHLWVYSNIQTVSVKELVPLETATENTSRLGFSYDRFITHLQQSYKAGTALALLSRTEAASRSALTGAINYCVSREILSTHFKEGRRYLSIESSAESEFSLWLGVNERVESWLNHEQSRYLLHACRPERESNDH